MSIPSAEPAAKGGQTSTVEVPVLIVGAGPAGLALSVALSRYGVGHLVVERHRGTAHTPRPDRHVAWRSVRYTPDSARQLPAVIEQALGLAGR